MFYGSRGLASQCVWTHWERCEEEWRRNRPVSYPGFQAWFRAAEAQDLFAQVPVARLTEAVGKYVFWEAFVCWLRPLLENDSRLPRRVALQVEHMLPGFLETAKSHASSHKKERVTTTRLLMSWIASHRFPEAKRGAWLAILRKQAHAHPQLVRITEYARHLRSETYRQQAREYPSFERWRRAAEHYVKG